MCEAFNSQTQQILNRCDTLRQSSRQLLREIRVRSRSYQRVESKDKQLQQDILLHNYLEQKIISSAKFNSNAAKYVKKQIPSPYLKNPALYNKLITGVIKKKLTDQSIASKQFLFKQEKSLWKLVNQSEFHGFN